MDIQNELTNEKQFIIQFIFMSIATGIISALFTLAISFATKINLALFQANPKYMFIFTPVVFTIISFLLKKYFPYADGSGLPQGYAIDVFSEERLNQTYSIRSMIGKIILTFMSILAGASLGKEGPTIQICSSLYASIKNISEKRRRLITKLGAGVGVAAAFNSPLGGMVFAIEEYVRAINARLATYLVLGTVVAVYCANLLLGNTPYLGSINSDLLHPGYLIGGFALIIGGVCGVAGSVFTKLVVLVTVDKKFAINRWRRKYHLINAFCCGLIVAFIGYHTLGYSFGNGTDSVRIFLEHNTNGPWYFALSKFFGAIASVAAFVPGGYFSTALAIGAGIGYYCSSHGR
ncbi:MAG: hypothetical protein K0R49_1099 [Burkholderiales bacterium]|nr:hypothetical protein [Burkholderiales bacterium]